MNSWLKPKNSNEKKGPDGLWQSRACVPSALLLSALNFALKFFLFDPDDSCFFQYFITTLSDKHRKDSEPV